MNYRDLFRIDATLIANEFLEKYMPRANGDYVKVYLYLLKNRAEHIDYGMIAEALSLTEGDVRRAVRYWEKEGILSAGQEENTGKRGAEKVRAVSESRKASDDAVLGDAETADASSLQADARAKLRSRYRRAEGAQRLNLLSEDADFSQLLFVVQKYMSKILTDNEQQVFAYLYDGLGMSCELLDYLVAYCVQRGHSNIRYIEKVGLDWAERGVSDVAMAKQRTKEFDRAAEEVKSRRTAKESRQGTARGTDYDSLVIDEVLSRRM